jgi:hypothetical protein
MILGITSLLGVGAAGLFMIGRLLRWKALHLWLLPYILNSIRHRSKTSNATTDIFVCMADHFEPAWGRPALRQQQARVQQWVERYPRLATRHRDWDGHPPQHSFFFPAEQYGPEHLDALASLCRAGFGDVEIHLHHDGDTGEGLAKTLCEFKTVLYERHGLLRRNPATQAIEFGFIHGDWALDNSSPDGRHCGVNNELQILRRVGCYADFTMPSAPAHTQTSKINSIYYATDNPNAPKSHDRGTNAAVRIPPSGDLLCIQGPLALNRHSRKWGIFPRIETGELSPDNPPSPNRTDLWIRQGIGVLGRPEWVFVKLHTHGAHEVSAAMLLGWALEATWSDLEQRYNDGRRFRLHYVTAYEMYRLVKHAEAGDFREASLILTELRTSQRQPDIVTGASPVSSSGKKGEELGMTVMSNCRPFEHCCEE